MDAPSRPCHRAAGMNKPARSCDCDCYGCQMYHTDANPLTTSASRPQRPRRLLATLNPTLQHAHSFRKTFADAIVDACKQHGVTDTARVLEAMRPSVDRFSQNLASMLANPQGDAWKEAEHDLRTLNTKLGDEIGSRPLLS